MTEIPPYQKGRAQQLEDSTRYSPEILAEGSQDVLMCFEADPSHHQHAVAKQALNALLVQLLEEMAAVGSNRVHAKP